MTRPTLFISTYAQIRPLYVAADGLLEFAKNFCACLHNRTSSERSSLPGLQHSLIIMILLVFASLARGQVISAGWNSLNSMPITAKYGAQMAHATDDGSRIYVAAAWESTSETSTPNFESYMKYTTLTDTWLSGAPKICSSPGSAARNVLCSAACAQSTAFRLKYGTSPRHRTPTPSTSCRPIRTRAGRP